jgi:hypothetical protein
MLAVGGSGVNSEKYECNQRDITDRRAGPEEDSPRYPTQVR